MTGILSFGERRILAVLMERLFADPPEGMPPADTEACLEVCETLLKGMDRATLLGLRALIHTFQTAAIPFFLQPRGFVGLSRMEQERYLDWWEKRGPAGVRTAFLGLRALCATAFCSTPALERYVGYEGPP